MTLTAPFPATINVPAGCKPVLQVVVFTSIWLRFQHLPSPVGCIRLSTCFACRDGLTPVRPLPV